MNKIIANNHIAKQINFKILQYKASQPYNIL